MLSVYDIGKYGWLHFLVSSVARQALNFASGQVTSPQPQEGLLDGEIGNGGQQERSGQNHSENNDRNGWRRRHTDQPVFGH